MAQYIKPEAVSFPPQANYASKVSGWPMMANDRLGDCTCAAAGHMIEAWTGNAKGAPAIVSDTDIVNAYSAVSGYNQTTGLNDNGANELDVLKYWRKTGIGGHKISAFLALEPTNHSHIKAAVYLFGGCYIGVALPLSAQDQDVWAVPAGGAKGKGEPGSWGGHAVPVVAYDALGLTVVTWGALKKMTWAFWKAYCDEAYAVLSKDFFNGNVAPNKFDMAQLEADLKLL